MDDLISPRALCRHMLLVRQAFKGMVYRTPLESCSWLSAATGAHVALKLECFQSTGSFKIRGAIAALASLSVADRGRGIITVSAGNHGLGVAYAASQREIDATILVPEGASTAKVTALRRYPVTLIQAGADYDAAEQSGRQLAHCTGKAFVSPYNDTTVIAGQGTIGMELLEDAPDLDMVLVPVGGGGLITGIAAWMKTIRPEIRIIGVQSEASPAMTRSLQAGQLMSGPVEQTFADGLAGNIEPGSITFPLAATLVDDMLLVSEAEIAEAIQVMFDEMHLLIEGSAAVGLAAVLSGRITDITNQRIAIVVTGRNIAVETWDAVRGHPNSGTSIP